MYLLYTKKKTGRKKTQQMNKLHCKLYLASYCYSILLLLHVILPLYVVTFKKLQCKLQVYSLQMYLINTFNYMLLQQFSGLYSCCLLILLCFIY